MLHIRKGDKKALCCNRQITQQLIFYDSIFDPTLPSTPFIMLKSCQKWIYNLTVRGGWHLQKFCQILKGADKKESHFFLKDFRPDFFNNIFQLDVNLYFIMWYFNFIIWINEHTKNYDF